MIFQDWSTLRDRFSNCQREETEVILRGILGHFTMFLCFLFHDHYPSTFVFVSILSSQIKNVAFLKYTTPSTTLIYCKGMTAKKIEAEFIKEKRFCYNSKLLEGRSYVYFHPLPSKHCTTNTYWLFMNERVKRNQLIWRRPSFVERILPFA